MGGPKLPIGPKVVPFWGSYLELYRVILKRNYYGAYGYSYTLTFLGTLKGTLKGTVKGTLKGTLMGSSENYPDVEE